MLHYINNIFYTYKNDSISFKKMNLTLYNRAILILFKFFCNVTNVFITTLQRRATNLYTVLTQYNRLEFKNLPDIFKFFLVIFMKQENSTIANKIYHIRKNRHKYLHNLWVFYFENTLKYYNELNSNCSDNLEISNFYYIVNKHKPRSKYKLIIFYYFGKVVLNKNPYFYWVHNKNVCKNLRTNKGSQHLRTQLFFMFIKFFDNMGKNNVSYIKYTLKTFKGVANFFLYNMQEVSFIPKKNFKKKTNLYNNNKQNYKKSNRVLLLEKLKTLKTASLQFTKNGTFNSLKKLIVIWYNKIHYTTYDVSKKSIVLYLRSSRHFNKGRYSRNRQLYRTGVYWCIWLNVVIVYGLYYYFYRVVFSFGYLWLPLCIMSLSIFSSRLYKYRYYNINQIVIEFREYNKFIYSFFITLQFYLSSNLKNLVLALKKFAINYRTILVTFLQK